MQIQKEYATAVHGHDLLHIPAKTVKKSNIIPSKDRKNIQFKMKDFLIKLHHIIYYMTKSFNAFIYHEIMAFKEIC